MSPLFSDLRWISSIKPENVEILENLRIKLETFYKTNSEYYENIKGSQNLWLDQSYLPYQKILNNINDQSRFLEVGCGNAAILSYYPYLMNAYVGTDFSKLLIRKNKENYPGATFDCIIDSKQFPFKNKTFDCVFSVFVLEHVIYPSSYIEEAIRVLKIGGRLLILCPDYFGHFWMASQRVGLSQGSGREKLSNGKILDAIITGFDSRIRVPIYAATKKIKAFRNPKFYININPVCFEDTFKPDVDAVYVTYEREIKRYSQNKITWIENDSKMKSFCKKRRLIFIEGIKR